MKSFALFVCIILCIASSLEAQKLTVCYWGTWSAYRTGHALFEPNNIDPNICTHIIYSFFGVTADGQLTYLDPWVDLPDGGGKDFINKFVALKRINPNVKLLAAVGGWNFGSVIFSQLASNIASRRNFALNTLEFLNRWGFDGIDIDWEYPAQRGGVPADKNNFVLMLNELKTTLAPYQKLVTVAVAAAETSASLSYDIVGVTANVDFINLMTYDLRGSWDDVTGIHGALFAGPQDTTAEQRTLNVDACVNFWLSHGSHKEKLIVGIPLYGRTFTLSNPSNSGVGAPSSGPGVMGSFVGEGGFLAYNEICYTLGSRNRYWQEEQRVPYAVSGNQWVGYDDLESVLIKSDYILAKDLGGAMFWSIETDDFGNLCGNGQFPLITIVHRYMNGGVLPPTQAPPTTSGAPPTGPTVPTTVGPGFNCPVQNGYFRNPNDCTRFYICHNGYPEPMQCGAGLYFNERLSVCDWPQNVPECN